MKTLVGFKKSFQRGSRWARSIVASAALFVGGTAWAQTYGTSTYAGAALQAGSTDTATGPATGARFNTPKGVAVDSAGNLYVADAVNNSVRKIAVTTGITTTIGTGFLNPSGVAVDSSGNVYVADTGHHRIAKIVTTTVTILAGDATAGTSGLIDNATGTTARFFNPSGIAVNSGGTLIYVADTGNHVIRRIDLTGTVGVTTIAGTVTSGVGAPGAVNGTPGTAASFNIPYALALNAAGTLLFVADRGNHAIRQVDLSSSNAVTLFAGTAGTSGSTDAPALFKNPECITIDAGGVLYVSDSGNATVRKITSTGLVTTIAGTAGQIGTLDALGTAAQFQEPFGIAVNSSGVIYVTDAGSQTIRRLAAATAPSVTTPVSTPAGNTVTSGGSISFSTTLTGSPAPAVTWQMLPAVGGTFTALTITSPYSVVTTATTSTLTITGATSAINGNQYRVFASNGVPSDQTSAAVTLTVNQPPTITTQPSSQTVSPYQSAYFTIAVSFNGGTLTYQWQRRAAGTIGYSNLLDSSVYLGTNTATLTVVNPTQQMSGDRFQVVVSTGVGPPATSDSVTLTVNQPPQITSLNSASFVENQSGSFTVQASGSPPPSFSLTSGSLPSGLSLNASNGLISGIPAAGANATSPYLVQITASNGVNPSATQSFTITINAPPTITTQPASATVLQGQTATFSVTATGSPAPTFLWRKNGVAITGATDATLSFSSVQVGDAGNYDVVVSNSAGAVSSDAATLVVATACHISNLSLRTTMGAGQTLVVGVVVSGGPRSILVRAAGPALAAFGIGGAMADPRLDLFNGSSLVSSNDDWPASLASTFAAVGAFSFPAISRDAALVQSIDGARSIQVRGTGAGIVLVEAYDTGGSAAARLINVSARNRVGTGDDILIVGFNISGSGAKQLLIRAVGPKLGAFGVSGFLADPKLEIYGSAGTKLTENDNWAASLAATFAAVGAFSLDNSSRDAALLATLPPGSYTAQVRGADGGSGEALIEIYETSADAVANDPYIVGSPSTQTVLVGNPVTLSVIAGGTAPFSYQWRKNSAAVTGATNASWMIPNVQIADTGSYDVVVTNAAGSTTSEAASLTVAAVPTITSQPSSQTVVAGQSASFVVTATGSPAPSFQWRKNGSAIGGATSATYTLANPQPNDAGTYTVVVSNSFGSVTSDGAVLAVNSAATITLQPLNRFVRLGEPVTLTTAATGIPAPSFQWSKGGVAISDATFGAYSIASVTASDLGTYTVTASNGIGAPSTSNPATIALRGNGLLGRRFLAAGAAGTVLVSNDGLTWSARTTDTTIELRGVAGSGDLAVAVGVGGTILTSSDTGTWTVRTSPTTRNLNGVVAGPDRFVAVGDLGTMLVSPNGMVWTAVASVTGSTLNGVTYGNGLYVAVGSGGALFTSPDGSVWANGTSQSISSISRVVFAGPQFWAITAGNQVLTSPDAINWTAMNAAPPAWLHGLAYDGVRLVAVGDGGKVSTSPDGVVWTARDSGSLQNLLDLAWTGPEVPVGIVPVTMLSNLNFRIVSQPRSYSTLPGQAVSLTVAAAGSSLSYQWMKGGTPIAGATQNTLPWTSVQASDVGDYSVIVTGAEGTLTSSVAKIGFIGGGPLGGQFIAVGAEGTVVTSTDGASFVARASNSNKMLRAVTASAYRAVAVGRDGALAWSDEGTNWAFSSLPTGETMRGVAAGPDAFVAVGNRGLILISYDQGDTWQAMASGTTQALWGVAWNGRRFLAVGQGGVVLSSPDGVSWQAAATATTSRLYTVAANGTTFVAVTDNGQTYTTADDGSTWQNGTLSGALWVRSAALASSGRRIVVGDSGLIASSDNGVDWDRRASPTSERLYSVVWTGWPATLPVGTIGTAVNGPTLRIITPPVSVMVTSGSTATFSVVAAGVSPLSYQWKRNGVDLSGAVAPTLLLANAQTADAGAYSVAVTSPTGSVISTAATLEVTIPGSGAPPEITAGPPSRVASVGGATTFSVVATGSPPLTYLWQFNGQTIPGALTASLVVNNLQLANAGSYTAKVTNPYGTATSQPALLTVTNTTGAPVINAQPIGQAVAAGSAVAFAVSASGNGTLTYQWRKDGAGLMGATQASFTIAAAALSDAGTYEVIVANLWGSATSEPAGLTVVPPGTTAVHGQTSGIGYVAGGTVTIRSTLSFVGSAEALGWEVLLPAGWSFVSASGAQGDVMPRTGDSELLSWAWTVPPASPVTFNYIVGVPPGANGTYSLAALGILRQGGVPIQLVARPDPLLLAPAGDYHSADTDGNHRISLLELTRVIELYNTRNGTTRTGCYVLQPGTEDGYAPDTTRTSGTVVNFAAYYAADSNCDGKISLLELTRVIELYNVRSGTVRTGAYHAQAGTEDGFAPGP